MTEFPKKRKNRQILQWFVRRPDSHNSGGHGAAVATRSKFLVFMGDPTEPVRPPALPLSAGKPDGSASVQSDPMAPKSSSDASADQKLQFLYKALDDNQGVIRFLDAKAAFAVALLSAMTGKVLADLPFYFPLASQPVWRKGLLFGFWILGLLTGFVVFRVIFP